MKFLTYFFIALAMCSSLHLHAEDILVMDTIEFNTVRHDTGKRLYVQKLTDILKRMRLKKDTFDSMNSDQHEIYELIQSNARWNEITAEIEKSCRIPAQKQNCVALAKLRLETFNFIKQNPQNYSPEPEPQAFR